MANSAEILGIWNSTVLNLCRPLLHIIPSYSALRDGEVAFHFAFATFLECFRLAFKRPQFDSAGGLVNYGLIVQGLKDTMLMLGTMSEHSAAFDFLCLCDK